MKKLKKFLLKVSQYNSGEGYEGYWLCISDTFENATKELKNNDYIKWLESLGGLEIDKSTPEEMLQHFNYCQCGVTELIGDNYN